MPAYHRPTTLEEALAIRAGEDVTVLAGGTDVYPAQGGARRLGRHAPSRHARHHGRCPSLRGIAEDADALAHRRADDLDRPHPRRPAAAVRRAEAAAREIGGVQIQNRGTLAGNICTASPAGDGAPNLLALDAESGAGEPARPPRRADGRFHRRLSPHRSAAADEIVTAILVPKPQAAARSHFLKLGARRYLVISIVMAAGVIETDAAGAVAAARIAVGACSAVPQRLPALEAALIGQPLEAAADIAAPAHLAPLAPIDDIRGSAAYRRHAALALVRDLLAELASASRRRAA